MNHGIHGNVARESIKQFGGFWVEAFDVDFQYVVVLNFINRTPLKGVEGAVGYFLGLEVDNVFVPYTGAAEEYKRQEKE